MAQKIAINGLGRIGKLLMRVLLEKEETNLIAINDPIPLENIIPLLRYDSVHGKYNKNISSNGDDILINGKTIRVFHEDNPEKLPWAELGIDIVIESSGVFKSASMLQKHIDAGAKKVILSQPAIDTIDRTVVIGVNANELKSYDRIISNASCTTNCIAPLIHVLKNSLGVKKVFFNTVHPATNNQSLLDGYHKDVRRSRSAMCNIIPTSSSAVGVIDKIIPELKGKINGFATRVPITIGSYVEIVVSVSKPTTVAEVNEIFAKATKNLMKGIIEYSQEALVSSDIIGNNHSAIFDALSTKIIDGDFVQILAWYDNETAYVHRIIDLINLLKNI